MNIDLIVATDSQWGIAKNGNIPWLIKEDLNFFQDVTKANYDNDKKNIIIMGKNTWKSLNENVRALNNRVNIIISSTMTNDELDTDNKTGEEAYLCKNIDLAIDLCYNISHGYNRIFICGGSQIYKEMLQRNLLDNIYLTKIDHDYNCDIFFPHNDLLTIFDINELHFKQLDETFVVKDKANDINVKVNFTKIVLKPNNKKNINLEEHQYLNMLKTILSNGQYVNTRNGNTWSTFGQRLEFDLELGFPLLTTKKIFFRGIFEELLFFLKGDTNAKHLVDKGINIWTPNTTREFLDSVNLTSYEEYDMGPMYGFQWLHFNAEYKGMNYDYTNLGVNQIKYCVDLIKKDPHSRRIMMTTYNPEQAKEGCLYPCHGTMINWYVDSNNRLSCMMTQRSADSICGIPFNIGSYALLVHMFCEIINNDVEYAGPILTVGKLIISLADTHIYEDHYEQTIRFILREPYAFPQLKFTRKVCELTDFKFEDVELVDYVCYPNVPTKMVA